MRSQSEFHSSCTGCVLLASLRYLLGTRIRVCASGSWLLWPEAAGAPAFWLQVGLANRNSERWQQAQQEVYSQLSHDPTLRASLH